MIFVQEVFTKSPGKFFSWAIRFFTKPLAKETDFNRIPSHTAILKGQFIYESTFFHGVRIVPFEAWKQKVQIITMKPRQIDLTESEFEQIFVDIWGKKYDWPGVLYFAWRIVLLWFFKKPMPTKNKWNSPKRFFCSEANGRLFKIDNQMKAPIEIMES